MKIIFAAILFACFAFSANAQVKPNLLQNQLNSYKLQPLKIDTSGKLMPVVKLNVPESFFSMLPIRARLEGIPNIPGTEAIYTRMPVKHIVSDDKMPIANFDAAGAIISVKRITVIGGQVQIEKR